MLQSSKIVHYKLSELLQTKILHYDTCNLYGYRIFPIGTDASRYRGKERERDRERINIF